MIGLTTVPRLLPVLCSRVWCGAHLRTTALKPLPAPAPIARLACPSTGGGKKKLKRREREALLQQHGIQVHGKLKHPTAAAAFDAGVEGEGDPQRPVARQPAPPVDEDDDIFGDAGTDYQPTVKDKQRAAAAAAAAEVAEQRRGGYFGQQEDLHADLPPLPKDGAWGLLGALPVLSLPAVELSCAAMTTRCVAIPRASPPALCVAATDGDMPPPLPADEDLMGPSAGGWCGWLRVWLDCLLASILRCNACTHSLCYAPGLRTAHRLSSASCVQARRALPRATMRLQRMLPTLRLEVSSQLGYMKPAAAAGCHRQQLLPAVERLCDAAKHLRMCLSAVVRCPPSPACCAVPLWGAAEVQEEVAVVARQEKQKDKRRAADVLGGDDGEQRSLGCSCSAGSRLAAAWRHLACGCSDSSRHGAAMTAPALKCLPGSCLVPASCPPSPPVLPCCLHCCCRFRCVCRVLPLLLRPRHGAGGLG